MFLLLLSFYEYIKPILHICYSFCWCNICICCELGAVSRMIKSSSKFFQILPKYSKYILLLNFIYDDMFWLRHAWWTCDMFYLQTQCSCLLVYFFSERSVFKFKAFFCLLRVCMKESAAQNRIRTNSLSFVISSQYRNNKACLLLLFFDFSHCDINLNKHNKKKTFRQ